jgi:lysophospholipase L1-like esterase
MAAAVLAMCGLAAGCAAAPTAPEFPTASSAPPAVPPPPAPAPVLRYTRFLTFGDSLTEGLSTPDLFSYDPGTSKGYPFKLRELLAARYTTQTIQVHNAGLGGHRAVDDLDRLTNELTDKQPDVTILLEGTNDLATNVSVTDTIAAMSRLCLEIRNRGSRLLLSTLPPQRPGGPRASAPAEIVPFNQALAALAPTVGATLVDIYPLITTPLADGLLAPDGLHLTEAGNARIAQAYFNTIKSLWEQPGVAQPDEQSRRPPP